MFGFILDYVKSKFFYMILKVEIYRALNHSEDVVSMVTKLAIASKDMTPEEIKNEFMREFAGVIHDSVHKYNKNGKS